MPIGMVGPDPALVEDALDQLLTAVRPILTKLAQDAGASVAATLTQRITDGVAKLDEAKTILEPADEDPPAPTG